MNVPEDLVFEDVTVQLSGEDGNVFSIIGRCTRAIRKVHGQEASARWQKHVMGLDSYHAVLAFCMETLDVN